MRFGKLGRAVVVASLCASMGTASEANTVAGLARQATDGADRLREGKSVLAPFPYIRFCVQHPEDCHATQGALIEWTKATRTTVWRANASVNRAMRPRNDAGDTWTADAAFGDCEDFVLTKRRRLVQAGLPASALRIAVARTRSGEGHAVLVLKTTAGDFVLDNRDDRLRSWRDADLDWIKISSAENPRSWRLVS